VTNNDVLRRLRYILDLNDDDMMALFTLGGRATSRAEVSDWLKREDDPAFRKCPDRSLAVFLNGLIADRRGVKEGGLPPAEEQLNNNIIFRKLKIAFDLQAEDVLALLELADFRLSKHELSAFFRKAGHKHYRECKDQILRNFLGGLQIKHRPSSP